MVFSGSLWWSQAAARVDRIYFTWSGPGALDQDCQTVRAQLVTSAATTTLYGRRSNSLSIQPLTDSWQSRRERRALLMVSHKGLRVWISPTAGSSLRCQSVGRRSQPGGELPAGLEADRSVAVDTKAVAVNGPMPGMVCTGASMCWFA